MLKRLFPGKSASRLIARIVMYLFLGGVSLVFLLFVLVWAGFFGKLPGKDELKNINHQLASEVYSADSVLLGRYFIQERSFSAPSEIPECLKKSLIATEDIRFYEHNGIDYKSLGRVLIKSLLLQKESSGGGSTLTQQLAKNLYPRKSYTFLSLPVNKIREMIIASRLESYYSKNEILALYLNTIPFADNTYGIKTAADRFFSIPVRDLDCNQSAVLVGMLKATHHYNPRLFPERSLQRRNVVISQLAKYNFITQKQKEKFQAQPLVLKYNYTSDNDGLAPYFRSYIQRELIEWCKEHKKSDGSSYNLYTDGLKIYTTIDSRLQAYAEEAVKSQMKILQERFKSQIAAKKLNAITIETVRQLPQYKLLKSDGLGEKKILSRLKEPVQTKVFSWDGEKEVKISLYDSVKHHLQFLQTGLMAMNPHNGNVLVWVGGINHGYFKYDHVRESTKRQVGSTFKPILYAAALESGISPCDYISARKTVYSNMEDWTPENTSDETYDKKYSMEGGLAGSVNTVSVKLIEETGVNKAIEVAKRMGIKSKLPPVPSIALGTPSISVFEMVNAYSVLANQGIYVEPRFITTIADKSGNVLERFKSSNGSQAVSKETARMMIDMLQSVVSSGTGASLRTRYGLTNDLAGKTGTTQSNVDGWFIAITPHLVTGCWVGADNPQLHFQTTALGQGAATALPVIATFIQKANKDKNLRSMMFAKFEPLPDYLADKMNCAPSKSNLNIFQKIFKKKNKVKVAKFKRRKTREPS
jgi:penicillin-binding protein 1A